MKSKHIEIRNRVYELKYWKKTRFGAETKFEVFETREELIAFLQTIHITDILSVQQVRNYDVREV